MTQTINSHTIKMDMNSSLERLLKEVGIIQNSETRINEYQKKINHYVELNKGLIEKAENLNKFGFVNTPSPRNKEIIDEEIRKIQQDIKDIEKEIRDRKALQATIAKYSIEYPSFKFIPTKTMIEVMKKYDLVLGETCMYKKEVPTIALDILEGFSDKIKTKKMFIDARFVRENLTYFSVRPSESVIGNEKPSNYIQSNLKIIAPESHFENRMVKTNGIELPTFIVNEETRNYEINMAKLTEFVTANTEVLDPILALEVEEGYIILHAWDDEALIPEIINTMLN